MSTHLPKELYVIQKALRELHGATRPDRSQVLNDLHCQARHVTALLRGYGESLAAFKQEWYNPFQALKDNSASTLWKSEASPSLQILIQS